MSPILRAAAAVACFCLILAASTPVSAEDLGQQRLDNGLKVLLKEAHGGPMVAAIVTVGAGSRYEDAANFGASHFLEHMVFNGTPTRSREDINEGIKDFGGYINATTRREFTCYILLVPREYLAEGLAIQADMLFSSTLPPDEFEKEKRVVIEEMHKDYDSGSYRGEIHRDERILGGTPYAHPVLGTVETIQNLEREQVLAYYKARYRPDNCQLFLVGDFKTREALELIEELYGAPAASGPEAGPEGGLAKAIALTWPQTPDYELYRTEEGEPTLDLYWLAPAIGSGRYPAQRVLATILSDEHRSPLRQGEGGPIEVEFALELFADFTLLHASVNPGEADPAELLDRLSRRLGALADWVPAPELVAEAARGLRVEDVFLQDTYHYYAMMQAAELHLGGREYLASFRDELKGLSLADLRGALESSLLAGPPRLIWSAQDGGLEELSPAQLEGFQPLSRHLELDDAPVANTAASPEASQRPNSPVKDEHRREQLANGLTVLVHSNPASEVFAAHVLIRGRSAREPEGKAGMVALAHELLTAGTASRDEAAIEAELSAMGAHFKTGDNPWIPFDDYYTREDFSYLRLEVLDESAEPALALLAELLGEASYPEAAVEAQKGKMLAKLSMGSPSPQDVADEALNRRLFGGSRRASSIGGTAESIGSISAEDLRAFHPRYFDPRQMILSVVSGLPAEEVLSLVQRHMGGLRGEAEDLPPTLLTGGPLEEKVPLEKAQVAILAARIIPPQGELEAGLPVLADILSARMGLELREKQGLAYSLGAGLRFVPGLAPGEKGFGLIVTQIATGSENREQARQGMEAEMRRLVSEPPSEQEVFRAVNGRWGRELMRDLSRIHQAYRMGLATHLGEEPFEDSEKEAGRQRAVKGAEISALADKYLIQSDWIWVLAGGGLE